MNSAGYNFPPAAGYAGAPSQLFKQPQPVRQRASVRELLRQKNHQYAPLATSYEDMRAMRREHEAMNNVAANGKGKLDKDYPTTPEMEQECVRRLFLAIVDFSDIIEKDDHYQKGRVQDLSNFEIHCIAWDILV
jgi:hypothetical protein